MDGLWATKSKVVELIVRAISLKDFQPHFDYPQMQTVDKTAITAAMMVGHYG